MPTNRTKRSSLLRYWTVRYVVTLSAGLLMIGVAAVIGLQQYALHERLGYVRSLALDAAEYIVNDAGRIHMPDQFYAWINRTQRRYRLPGQLSLTVFDQRGGILFYSGAADPAARPTPEGAAPAPLPRPSVPEKVPGERKPEALDSVPHRSDPRFRVSPALDHRVHVKRQDEHYLITAPVIGNGAVIGGMIGISYAKQELTDIRQQYGLITALLTLSGILGWLILYAMLRRMTKPIHEVVSAFKQIGAGSYMLLEEKANEHEIYELLVYFNAMAARLEQLEQLRAEMLAGVTHELRTPITSIRGLTRAVRDQVVAAAEADEFLDITLSETRRLEQMVTDLLDFHAFASGTMRIDPDEVDLGRLLREIRNQWGLLAADDRIDVVLHLPDHPVHVFGDAGRIRQIMLNLLTNSRQAMGSQGKIRIIVSELSMASYAVLVADTGSGIPPEEQNSVFERYYRGSNKKGFVHGLGLGLTISRMLALAMSGELILQDSSSEGTTFRLVLPKRQAGEQ
ncbi:signal transduction histidine kinase [Paenibacillus phyllosphaerae]|uniref:histidine kinase n=1 Tax=Paenibacillus phyllosphaerae TaxID=274593 RepID=A0A7W5AV89_9BACL|nr:HAMP domain-containing sensor histidine kinase [Paenibacillus phyllosphaerae]MBB3108816.1 signal transduction histidine kinase [Paenibacillus phyllosphaerae]